MEHLKSLKIVVPAKAGTQVRCAIDNLAKLGFPPSRE
jgi:hypothetical protein